MHILLHLNLFLSFCLCTIQSACCRRYLIVRPIFWIHIRKNLSCAGDRGFIRLPSHNPKHHMGCFRACDGRIGTKCPIRVSIDPSLLCAVCNRHIICIIRTHICVGTWHRCFATIDLSNPVDQLTSCNFLVWTEISIFFNFICTDLFQPSNGSCKPI